MGRVLPMLCDGNSFYWTSGADGRPRFQHCGACDTATAIVTSGGLTPGAVVLFRRDQ